MKATMLLDGPTYQMYLFCIYFNRFVQNTGYLQLENMMRKLFVAWGHWNFMNEA